jgi:hypothetical protein
LIRQGWRQAFLLPISVLHAGLGGWYYE